MGKVCCVNKAIDTEDFYGPDTNEIRFGRRLASAFKTASNELIGAWDSLDPQTAEQAYQAILRLPWQESFGAFQTEWEESTREVMTEAGERSFRDLRGRVSTTTSTLFTTSFTVENPYSRVYIRERSSKLIVQITDETREAVKVILDNAIRNGEPPRAIRTRIGNTVGLFDRWASAVDRRYSELLASGVPRARRTKRRASITTNFFDDEERISRGPKSSRRRIKARSIRGRLRRTISGFRPTLKKNGSPGLVPRGLVPIARNFTGRSSASMTSSPTPGSVAANARRFTLRADVPSA